MKAGVNSHGVQWVQDGERYYCTFYVGDGVEYKRTFEGLTKKQLQNIMVDDLK